MQKSKDNSGKCSEPGYSIKIFKEELQEFDDEFYVLIALLKNLC